MINDVLEQLAEDYFRHEGYFTQHNVKYRPSMRDPAHNVHSDIDIIGIHPTKSGIDKVIVVNAKSYLGGLNINWHLNSSNRNKLEKRFREMMLPVWAKALREKVKQLTGRDKFIIYTVCVSYREADKRRWLENETFLKNTKGCRIEILDAKTMFEEIWKTSLSRTPAHSELSRLLQMIYHSKAKLEYK